MQRTPLTEPKLLPFLPMVYVAWADGELSDPEIVELRTLMTGLDCVDDACRQALAQWLDPQAPPTARELAGLLESMRQLTPSLEPQARESLIDLGLELARAGLGAAGGGLEAGIPERDALQRLDEALGYPSRDKTLEIFLSKRTAPSAGDETRSETFAVHSLQHLLDAEHSGLRQEIKALLSSPAFHPRELPRAEYREQVLEWCRVLAASGFGSLSYPVKDGGSADLGAFVVAFETLALGDLSLLVKFGVQFGLWGGSILNLGTEQQQRDHLPGIGSLELPGCFAMSETGHGSNVREIETTVHFDTATGELVVDTPNDAARKDYIGNAACHGQMATVFAQLEIAGESHGVHAVIVPIRDSEGRVLPGVRIEDCGRKIGLNGVDNGRIWFDQVRVPRDHLLGRFAEIDSDGGYSSPIASPSKRFFTMLGTLVGGRVAVAAGSLSAAKRGLAIAIRYGLERRQFGPPDQRETRLLDYPTHQRRLLPRLAKSYVLHFAIADLRRRFVARTEDDQQQVELLAAGLKAASSWHTIDTLQTCRECCGGAGYLSENLLGDLRADTDVFATFEGDNVVLLQLVAKGLLADYRQQFSDLRLMGVLRILARRTGRDLAEKNPIRARRTSSEHLRDGELQSDAIVYRADRLLASVAGRLRARIGQGMSSHQALIECQNHLVTAALAHVDRLLIESMAAAVDTADSELTPVLSQLRDLWALSLLEEHRAWYLQQGYFEAQKARAIRGEVERLCLELRPHARSLVAALGIPDALLETPMTSRG